jgi:nucleoside-triphosphatase
MITAFVFTKVQSHENRLAQGLLIGLQMNFRAVIIIVGFSVLGTELYNPRIRDFFLKTSFKQLPLALELSLESLPSMISNIPEFKTIVKNPISVIYQIISQVDFRLAEIKSKIQFNQKVFIITGSIGQGKTAMVQKVIEVFREKGITVGGIYSPRVMENSTTIGYNIIDIATCDNEEFLRLNANESIMEIGRYKILPKGLQKGAEILKSSNNRSNKIVVIDEVGNLECENQGWATSMQDLIDQPNTHLLIVIRDSLAEKVIQKWNFKQPFVFNISQYDHLEISNLILEQLT